MKFLPTTLSVRSLGVCLASLALVGVLGCDGPAPEAVEGSSAPSERRLQDGAADTGDGSQGIPTATPTATATSGAPAASTTPTRTPTPGGPTPTATATPTATSTPMPPLDAMVLPRDKLVDSGNDNFPLAGDPTKLFKTVGISEYELTGKLRNSAIGIDRDQLFPAQLINLDGSAADLVFDYSSPKWMMVNVFHHGIEELRMLRDAGVEPSPNPFVGVDAHCNVKNNAYYDSSVSPPRICLGYVQSGGNKLFAAEGADVYYHEYGHHLNRVYAANDDVFWNPNAGAVDEGTADLWSFFKTEDPEIAPFFGTALHQFFSTGDPAGTPLRNISTAPGNYPEDFVGEVHEDAQFWSHTVYQLSQLPAFANRQKLIQVVANTMTDLQGVPLFDDALNALREEAVAAGAPLSAVNAILASRGLARKDTLENLQLPSAASIKIVDDHTPPLANTFANCNGKLDAREAARVIVDFKNTGSSDLGTLYVELDTDAPAGELVVAPGYDYGFHAYLLAGKTFLEGPALLTASPYRIDNLDWSAFIVQTFIGSAGKTYNFTVKVSGQNSIDETGRSSVVLPFSLTIGSAATQQTTCSNGKEGQVWP